MLQWLEVALVEDVTTELADPAAGAEMVEWRLHQGQMQTHVGPETEEALQVTMEPCQEEFPD